MIILDTTTIWFVFMVIENVLTVGIIEENYKNCRERNRPIETENGDLYLLVDATLGQKLALQCHYCKEDDDMRAKIWYKIDAIGISAPHEVQLDMDNDLEKSRIHVNKEHTLIIKKFSFEDTGLYYCKRYENDNVEEKYNYLVDLVYGDNITSHEKGNFSDWRQYYFDYFQPVNELFDKSAGVEFREIREQFRIKMELFSAWRPWGICEVCGRPKNEGVRRKTGLCRINLAHLEASKLNESALSSEQQFLLNANAVACRSMLLSRIFPGISNLTKVIPNFVQYQPCNGTCNPDNEDTNRAVGRRRAKKMGYKYRKSYVLAENSHLTIVCPECAPPGRPISNKIESASPARSSLSGECTNFLIFRSNLEHTVIWKRNGKKLKSGESVEPSDPDEEPRITVDTFGTLYLTDVRTSEEGNYTCTVDDIRMEQVLIYVVSKSRIITKAFLRFMMYLSFILSLTLPCYFAGIFIACVKKNKFKTYDELREEDSSDSGDDDNENSAESFV